MFSTQELLCELRKRHTGLMGVGAVVGKPPLEFKPLPIRHGKRQRLSFGTLYQSFTQRILFSSGEVLELLIDV